MGTQAELARQVIYLHPGFGAIAHLRSFGGREQPRAALPQSDPLTQRWPRREICCTCSPSASAARNRIYCTTFWRAGGRTHQVAGAVTMTGSWRIGMVLG